MAEKITVTISELFDVFAWGAAYGQLQMEQERASEELFDAATCYHSGRKYTVPSAPVRRRQLRSDKWFESMNNDVKAFKEFIAKKTSEAKE